MFDIDLMMEMFCFVCLAMAGRDLQPEETLNEIFLDHDSKVEPWDSDFDAEGSNGDKESQEFDSEARRYSSHC